MVSAELAAIGILLWRSTFRKLSLANYIIVLSCASVLVLWAFKMYEWFHVSNWGKEFFMADFGFTAVVLFAAVFGAWWASGANEAVTFTQFLKVRLWQAFVRLRERAPRSRPNFE